LEEQSPSNLLSIRSFFAELIEVNWRFWVFVAVLAASGYAFIAYPLLSPVNGYLRDPTYTPVSWIIPIPLMFRLTCYYYRKAYHRHLFTHPLQCGITEHKGRIYGGERGFFIFNNLHRYFLYAAIIITPFLVRDFVNSLFVPSLGLALTVGGVLLLANAVSLILYTWSCHSLRHLLGGNLDCYSCVFAGKERKAIYDFQSWFNRHHMLLAWTSLIIYSIVVVYIRGVAAGIIPDPVLL
jgi:hypothetical protein